MEKKLKFSFVICDRENEKKIIKFLKNSGYDKFFLFYGKGSASNQILEYLGIGESEKVIIIYPTSEKRAIELMEIIKKSEYLKHILVFRSAIKGISSLKSLDYFIKED